MACDWILYFQVLVEGEKYINAKGRKQIYDYEECAKHGDYRQIFEGSNAARRNKTQDDEAQELTLTIVSRLV
jgi:hypothetical protein